MKKKSILILILCAAICLSACGRKCEHAFSVSEDSQVYFAGSNLQYCPASGAWRFAENAYDTIGTDNENISEDYDGYIDLFGWGATGAGGVEPYFSEPDSLLYGNGHNSIAGTEMDFGVAVEEQLGGGYRMLTHDEIHYLLMFRKNAEKLFGYGTINGIRGLFILPDDWKLPGGIDFTPSTEKGFENQYDWYYTIGDNDNYGYNNFTADEWDKMEANGAVFLPVTGMRYDTETDHVGISGHYWTSSYYGEEFANCLCLFEKDLFLEGNFDRCYGLAVRLVRDAD